MAIKRGQLVKISFEGREFEVIVIDPKGIGKEQASVGFGFRMMERHAGIAASTLSTWVFEKDDSTALKLPSGKELRVFDIKGLDGNNYNVIEASDWFDLVFDLLENPGKTSKSLKSKLLRFIKWFTIKGFYAEAYIALKGDYKAKDSRALSAWMEARISGKRKRNKYTDFLQEQGCEGYDYARWTDYVYSGLFGMRKTEMVQVWNVVEGSRAIGRNYIPEAIGLEAVAYCEDMTVKLFIDSLDQAHNDAIKYTKRKFFDGLLGTFNNPTMSDSVIE